MANTTSSWADLGLLILALRAESLCKWPKNLVGLVLIHLASTGTSETTHMFGLDLDLSEMLSKVYTIATFMNFPRRNE